MDYTACSEAPGETDLSLNRASRKLKWNLGKCQQASILNRTGNQWEHENSLSIKSLFNVWGNLGR